MTVSPLASKTLDIPAGDRWNPRNGPVRGFTIHHNAGVNSWHGAMSPARVVSANYWISNEGEIIPHVDEDFRAWTSGMPGYPAGAEADYRNVTVEVSNSPEGVASGSWAISAAAQDALSRLIGDVFRRHNLGPVRRGQNGGVAVHRDFGPTECPGPYIMAHLDQIIADAETYRAGAKHAAASPIFGKEDETMIVYYAHAVGKNKPGWLVIGYTPKALIVTNQEHANKWAEKAGKSLVTKSYTAFRTYLRAAGGTTAQLARVSKG